MSTGFIYDPAYLEHDTGHGHPECRRRLTWTWEKAALAYHRLYAKLAL